MCGICVRGLAEPTFRQTRNGFFLFSFVTVLFLVVLSGCWVPENFVANVQVDKDGGYTFVYDGTLAFWPALAAIKEGSFDKKMEEEQRDGRSNEERK